MRRWVTLADRRGVIEMAVLGPFGWKAGEGGVLIPSTAAGSLRGLSPADYGQSCCLGGKCRQGVPECRGSQDFQAAWLAGELALEPLGRAPSNQEDPDQRTAATKQQLISGAAPIKIRTYFQCGMQGRRILLPRKPG